MIVEQTGACVIPKQFCIELGGFDHWCTEAFIERMGSSTNDGITWVTLNQEPMMGPEEYHLVAEKTGVMIWASTETGVVRALTTLYQMADTGGNLPLCEIWDQPKYSHRGLCLDCSRHFFAPSVVKQIIEQISLVKLNVLHWHLADDQGWRIESKVFPKLHEISKAYYTQTQILDIVEYARIRGVEVIPEIDMPGHTTSLLAAYPQYSCFEHTLPLATRSGVYPVILCAGKDQIFEFLEALFEEICALFPSDRFHVGGDEAPKSEWKECPYCRRRMEQEGILTLEDLQGYFTMRIGKILETHGKKMICWDDTLKASEWPGNICIQHWTFLHEKQMEAYLTTGREWIYSNVYNLYLDYPHGMLPLKKVYLTNPQIGQLDCSRAKGLLGMEACLWTEHIETNQQLGSRLFPRTYAFAEAAWTQEKDYSDFRMRLMAFMERTQSHSLTPTAEAWWDPEEKEGIQEGIDYMKKAFFSHGEADNQAAIREPCDTEFWTSFIRGYFGDLFSPIVLKALEKELV